ncbi:fatty acid desaturase family protein [Caenispirillum bisanense]|uniref:Fatty acid desaturase n=1 Tax=Caenispirillum bisanense TaxID=414052 RepID=A0A286GWK9_9PROT|nr:fatty acid desaturase [Caenispirillum bisanense]SOD99925.1 Fatty acid desaturase [Caenispirillum bisanense]
MIDRAYFEAKPAVYFRDFLVSMAVFAAAFAWGVQTDGPLVVVAWGLAAAFLARAGIFGHEISHRPNEARMKPFYWAWHLTCGAVILVPTARFVGPHKAHHTTGIFRTKDDPQYLLVRSNRLLMAFVLIGLPLVTPVYTLLQAVIASIGGVELEERLDRFTRRRFNFSVSTPLPDDKKAEVTWLSRYYLLVFATFAVLVPQALPLYYAVLVGAWLIVVLRIPLEHELETYAETSVRRDQMRDSFTVETPLALLIQPIGFRYHTAHHMYPGVPYHNLPALHAHLKATVPGYGDSVVSYWTAIRGPKPKPSAADGAA